MILIVDVEDLVMRGRLARGLSGTAHRVASGDAWLVRQRRLRTMMASRMIVPLGLVALLLALGPFAAGALDWMALAALIARRLLTG